MLKRLLAAAMLLVILEIPLNKWRNYSEEIREGIRINAVTAFMKNFTPGTMIRFWDEIHEGMWQLHADPSDSCVPQRNKEAI